MNLKVNKYVGYGMGLASLMLIGSLTQAYNQKRIENRIDALYLENIRLSHYHTWESADRMEDNVAEIRELLK